MALLSRSPGGWSRPPVRSGRGVRAGFLASVLLLFPLTQARAEGNALELAVKANYLYKFTPFVEWPPRSFSTPASPFVICVIGEDPFGRVLDEAVQGQQVGQHPVVIRRAPVAAPGMGCHVVFAGRSETQSTADMLRVVSTQPVLTVTDQSRGVAGGMIQFVLRDGRVRFEIDAAAAEASGVTISSKLLGLALSVRKAMR